MPARTRHDARPARGYSGALLPLAIACVAAAVGAQTQATLMQQTAGLPALAKEARLVALTTIADALPFAEDRERAEATAALRRLAGDGMFFSPTATEPTMHWFEFERALRRSEVRDAGSDPQALGRTLQKVLQRRVGLRPMLRRRGGEGPSVYDITSFGWHGAGEVLEAVADLAERHGEAAREVGAELARYLACEKPHPLQPHAEGAAGLGEPAPQGLPAQRFPVLWSDGYRIALARAVLATRQPDVDTIHAVLHLLYSPRRADRLEAIARLRAAPLTADAVTHLVAQLADADRLVVREAISTLGGGGPAARAALPQLQSLADGTDKELAAIAARALQLLRTR